jgi:hypothetical protein
MASLTDLMRFRDDLQEARYSGARKVRDSSGEELEYKTDAEMAAALRALESQIQAASLRPSRQTRFQTSKGV